MDFWRFFRGSENPSVLKRTRIFRFSEKLKKARIIAVLQKKISAEPASAHLAGSPK